MAEKSQVSGPGFSTLLAGKDRCSEGMLHGRFLLLNIIDGAYDSFPQFNSCSTDVDIIQPSGTIGCWWLFGPLHLPTVCNLYWYVFGSFQSSFQQYYFHTSFTCYRACNIFLIMHTAELHIIYVHITSHDQ